MCNDPLVSVGGTAAYQDDKDLPPLVVRAVALAVERGFEYSCLPAQGRLLQVLARARRGGRIGETGTGCGVGLAWIVSAVDRAGTIVSAEIDAERAAAVQELFRDYPNVRVLSSNWKALEDHAPFDLLVLDGGGTGKHPPVDAERADPAKLLAPGGTLVMDDFGPPIGWPRRMDGQVDTARMAWLQHPELLATEIPVTGDMTAIVAMRR